MLATTVVVEILCVAIIVGALALGLPLGAALMIGGLVVTVSAVRIRGRPPAGHIAVWTQHLLRRWGFLTMPALAPAFDGASVGDSPIPASGTKFAQGPRPGRALSVSETTGFRWDGSTLVCAVYVRPRIGSVTEVSIGRADTADRLPLHKLSPLLSQFDIRLAGIDLVSIGSRVASRGLAAQVYGRLIGPLPAISRRDTLVLVRLDPSACQAAVARRGGGTLGAVRAAKVATARVIRALDAAGFHCELLTAPELDDSWGQHTGLGEGGALTPSWGSVSADEGAAVAVHTTYTADALPLTSPGIARVWDAATDRTVVSLRLRPSLRPEACQLGLLVRYTAGAPVRVPDSLGLRPLDGQHLDGVCATAPRGEPQFDRLCDFREVHPSTSPDLTVATAGCGQLIGGDNAGNAVTAAIFGQGVRTVEVIGEVYLARQAVLRAMALGARVLVRTDRPHAWRPLAREAAEPERLRILGPDLPSRELREYEVLVLDGPTPGGPHLGGPALGVTVITVLNDDDPVSASPDVRIRQDALDKDRLVLELGDRSVAVSIVTIPDETRLIGQPESSALTC